MAYKISFRFLLIVLPLMLLYVNCESEKSNRSVFGKAVVSDSTKPYSYSWLTSSYHWKNMLINRIALPEGYTRMTSEKNQFTHWLSHLPLFEGTPEVVLYNGSLKYNQDAHLAVFNIDVGNSDLQQCADAVMRLRAEFLYHTKAYNKIHFNFTNGFSADYVKWAEGYRIKVSGNTCIWVKETGADYSYKTFRKYLDKVFMYAGTQSLSQELAPVALSDIQPGDVFIKGGFPGHAVTVMEVATNKEGEKIFSLAQSYMPAQQIQLLKNPEEENSPWYKVSSQEKIYTPEWTFSRNELKRWK